MADSGDARPPRRTSVPARLASFPWEESRIGVRQELRGQRRCLAHVREATPGHENRASVSSARSERWRRPNTSQRIRRLRVDADEEVLLRTGEQPVDGAFVRRSRPPDEAIVPTVETLDLELLPRFDTV